MMNQADAEKLATVFDLSGFKNTNDIKKADVIILLACSVRQTAIDRVYGAFHKKKLKENVIKVLTGCVLNYDFNKLQNKFDFIIDITKIRKLPGLIKKHKKYYEYCPGNNLYLEVDSKRINNFEALIPVSNGCNQFCTYCAVPYTRGREMNRSAKKILNDVRKLGAEVKKITLLGQTVNSYLNPDTDSKIKDFAPQQVRDFADLLEQVAVLKPDAWITFMAPYPTKFNDKLINVIAKYENISKHIHLPLQSGSNKILKLMNRKYNTGQFLDIIEKIYKKIPNANITTDIIIGFPNETNNDFRKTINMIKKCNFTLVYTGLYSPRPGSVSAEKYKDNIFKKEKRQRDKQITELVAKQSKERNKQFVNTMQKVLVQSKTSKGIYIGKMQTYETVKVFNAKDEDLGKFIGVKITKALSWGLGGEKVRKKLIVVLGPNACGKTKIGVKLAKKFNGEIISADSRQVYKGMDIGTGKDLKEYGDIPYYLIDICSPKKQITLADWQKMALDKVQNINQRNKIPFLVGGTGLYINSIIDGYVLKDIKINNKLRAKLNKLSLKQLQNKLKKLDSKAFNKIDINNPRRLIRAIEIVLSGSSITQYKKQKPDLDILILGVKFPKDVIYKRINKRLKYRLEKQGMVQEVQNLRKKGVSRKKLDNFGLEYRWIAKYLKNEVDYEQLFKELSNAIHHFAKRQLTWFNRRKDIVWIKDAKEAGKLVGKFLS